MAEYPTRKRRVRAVVWALLAVLLLVVGSLALSEGDSDTRISLSSNQSSNPSSATTIAEEEVKAWGPFRAFSTAAGKDLNNGRTRIERSLGCEAGGDGDYWHFSSEAPLEAGIVTGPESNMPGDLRLYADVHSPSHGVRAEPEPVPGPDTNSAMLLPDSSHLSLSNQRGTIKLGLTAAAAPPAMSPAAAIRSTSTEPQRQPRSGPEPGASSRPQAATGKLRTTAPAPSTSRRMSRPAPTTRGHSTSGAPSVCSSPNSTSRWSTPSGVATGSATSIANSASRTRSRTSAPVTPSTSGSSTPSPPPRARP